MNHDFDAPLALPEDMRARPQWVTWKLEEREEKKTKVLYNPTAGVQARARANDPCTWGTFDEARAWWMNNHEHLQGVGYVIHKGDPYVVVDIDDCLGENGEISPEVQAMLDGAGSFAEFSQSLRGLHIYLKGSLAHLVPDYGRVYFTKDHPEGNDLHYGSRDNATGREIYAAKRFIAATGKHVPGTPTEVVENQAWIDDFYAETFGARAVLKTPRKVTARSTGASEGTDTPSTEEAAYSGLDGAELVEKAMETPRKNGKSSFKDLWTNNAPTLGESEKRFSLAHKLAWWCGPDPDLIWHLMQQSDLYQSDMDKDKFARDMLSYSIPKAVDEIEAKGSWYGSDKAPTTELDAELIDRSLDDIGLADRLIARHGEDIKYCEAEAAWYTWNERVWARQITSAAARRFGEATVDALGREVDAIPVAKGEDGEDKNKKWREVYRAYAKSTRSLRKINDMIGLAQTRLDIQARPEDFDSNQWLIACQNGTLDLKTGILRSPDRSDMLTQAIPVGYDPFADAPLWASFLATVVPDSDVRDYLQRYVGYSLTGLTREQCYLFLYGSGQNGKGTFMDTLAAMFGHLHARLDSEVITHTAISSGKARFGLGGILGRRLVTFSELEERSRFNEPLLKALTGEDPIEIELKGKQGFTYQPHAKFMLAGNHKPTITGTDMGIWRRTRLIPFEVTIPDEEKDATLREKLLAELPGILVWALDGLACYLKDGLKAPNSVLAATDEYRQDSDVLGQFISERCVLGDELRAQANELYTHYVGWCDASGHRPVARNVFGVKLKGRGYESRHNKFGSLWYGIGITANLTDDDADSRARWAERRAVPAATPGDEPAPTWE